MANSSVTTNPGSGGAEFSTDLVGGEHVPLGKIAFGDYGTVTLVTATAGLPIQNDDTSLIVEGEAAENAAVSGNPVLTGGRYDATPRTLGDGDVGALALDADGAVQISDGGNSITIDGTVTANLSSTDNTVLDNIDSGINTTLAGYLDGVEGLLTTIDSDTSTINTNVATIAGAVSGSEMQVDIVSGTVTVTSTALTDIETNTDSLAVVGGGTEATALRVTLANNSTGVLSVDDNGTTLSIDDGGGSITIDGTVTANLSATDNAVLDSIQAAVETIDNAISGSEMQVDIVSMPASSSAGDVAHDSADSGNPVKMGAKATTSLNANTSVADNDRTDLYAGVDGVLITRPHANLEDLVDGNGNATNTADTSVIAAGGAGIRTYITSITITNSSSTDAHVVIKDGTTEKMRIPAPANGGAVFALPVPMRGTANTAWQFASSGSVSTMYVSMQGFQSAV